MSFVTSMLSGKFATLIKRPHNFAVFFNFDRMAAYGNIMHSNLKKKGSLACGKVQGDKKLINEQIAIVVNYFVQPWELRGQSIFTCGS